MRCHRAAGGPLVDFTAATSKSNVGFYDLLDLHEAAMVDKEVTLSGMLWNTFSQSILQKILHVTDIQKQELQKITRPTSKKIIQN